MNSFLIIFYSLPSWATLLLIIAISLLFTRLGIELIQRIDPITKREIYNDIVGFIFAVVGVIYAVLLASVAIMSWEIFEKTQMVVDAEASASANITRLSIGLPQNYGHKIREANTHYVNAVIKEEWPTMQQGQSPSQAKNKLAHLHSLIVQYPPSTAGEQNIHDQMLNQLMLLLEKRRERLFYAQENLNHVVWRCAILGAFGTLAFSFLFGLNKHRHFLFSGTLAVLIALVVSVIIEMDYPFMGSVSVSNEPFIHVIESWDEK